jgi:hypothetical protein
MDQSEKQEEGRSGEIKEFNGKVSCSRGARMIQGEHEVGELELYVYMKHKRGKVKCRSLL